MKKLIANFSLFLSCTVLIAGGCASNEVVKKDESIAPVSTAPAKAVVNTPVKPTVKQTQAPKSASSESDHAGDVKKSSAQIEQLKSALEKIYFDFDSYKLSEKSRASLVKNAELLKKASAVNIQIEGNCDERGSAEYNLALGEKRAKVAVQYLVTLGIPSERLSIISYGKEKAADLGHDEVAWAKNRRDEFAVLLK